MERVSDKEKAAWGAAYGTDTDSIPRTRSEFIEVVSMLFTEDEVGVDPDETVNEKLYRGDQNTALLDALVLTARRIGFHTDSLAMVRHALDNKEKAVAASPTGPQTVKIAILASSALEKRPLREVLDGFSPTFDLGKDWVAGWVAGIYYGIDPDGNAHS